MLDLPRTLLRLAIHQLSLYALVAEDLLSFNAASGKCADHFALQTLEECADGDHPRMENETYILNQHQLTGGWMVINKIRWLS